MRTVVANNASYIIEESTKEILEHIIYHLKSLILKDNTATSYEFNI